MKSLPDSEAKPGTGSESLRRTAWLVLAWCSIGVGAAGVVLPLLPTTPFILLAAWASPKASPRLQRWLHDHPHFGPSLRAWREEGAVPTRAKITATVLLMLSWTFLWLLQTATLVLAATAILFCAVLTFLWSRPQPGSRRRDSEAV